MLELSRLHNLKRSYTSNISCSPEPGYHCNDTIFEGIEYFLSNKDDFWRPCERFIQNPGLAKTLISVSAYGYGLSWTKDCENKVFISHSGGLPGFGSNWGIMPDYGIGIISPIH